MIGKKHLKLKASQEPNQNRIVYHKNLLPSLTGEKIPPAETHMTLEEFATKAEKMVKAGEDKEKIAFVVTFQ